MKDLLYFFTRKEVGLDSLDKLKKSTNLRIGGQSIGHSNYVAARLFAWLLDIKDPKFVVGYSGAEIDVAIAQGELDARANGADAVVQRTPQLITDGLAHFHGVIDVPFGFRPDHPGLARLRLYMILQQANEKKEWCRCTSALCNFCKHCPTT